MRTLIQQFLESQKLCCTCSGDILWLNSLRRREEDFGCENSFVCEKEGKASDLCDDIMVSEGEGEGIWGRGEK